MLPAPSPSPESAADANSPYQLLAGVERALGLPALVCSSGVTAERLQDLPAWGQALLDGRLPERARDFGDPEALQVLRRGVEATPANLMRLQKLGSLAFFVGDAEDELDKLFGG